VQTFKPVVSRLLNPWTLLNNSATATATGTSASSASSSSTATAAAAMGSVAVGHSTDVKLDGLVDSVKSAMTSTWDWASGGWGGAGGAGGAGAGGAGAGAAGGISVAEMAESVVLRVASSSAMPALDLPSPPANLPLAGAFAAPSADIGEAIAGIAEVGTVTVAASATSSTPSSTGTTTTDLSGALRRLWNATVESGLAPVIVGVAVGGAIAAAITISMVSADAARGGAGGRTALVDLESTIAEQHARIEEQQRIIDQLKRMRLLEGIDGLDDLDVANGSSMDVVLAGTGHGRADDSVTVLDDDIARLGQLEQHAVYVFFFFIVNDK